MLGSWLVLSVALIGADAAKLAEEAALRDLNTLDGTWVSAGSKVNGKAIGLDKTHHMMYVSGNRQNFNLHLHGQSHGSEVAGSIELNPAASPKQFTATIDWHIFGASTIAGIYELGDDDLKICFSVANAARPGVFDAPAGGNYVLLTFTKLAANESDELRQAKKALAAADTPKKRFYFLGEVAKAQFEASNYSEARKLAEELLKLAASFPNNWNYGNAIQDGHIVLGRIAARNLRLDEANRHLREAGMSPGSPQMNSSGPDMTLARDLIERGQTETVVEYFGLCKKFWKLDKGNLDRWSEQVKSGKMPSDSDFRLLTRDRSARLSLEEDLEQLNDHLEKARKKK